MIVSHEKNIESIKIENPQAKDAIMKVLITPKDGWEGHVMRVVELNEGGYSQIQKHDWPHINYVIRGRGILHIDGVDHKLIAGSFAYVPSNKIHQFKNIGEEKFVFMCIVPEEGHK